MVLRLKPLELLFALFFAVIVVRVLPFTPRELLGALTDMPQVGTGRQIVTLGLALGIVAAAAIGLRFSQIAVPLPFLLLMGFALLSLIWSAVPMLGLKRFALTALVAGTLLIAAMKMRPKTTLDLIRRTCLALAIATLLAGIFYPQMAIHQSADPESSIVGAWRGIFYHKNLAGAVVGLAVVLQAEALLRERRLLSAVLLGLAVLVLVLTRSKTAGIAALLGISVLLGFRAATLLAGRSALRASLLRWSIATAGVTALLVGWFGGLRDYVLDPNAFTSRGLQWRVVAQLIEQRPLVGHGYESVFQSGSESAMWPMSMLPWVRLAPHSHNGVLDLLVTVGAIGLVLFLWAMFIDPWRRVSRLPDRVRSAWEPVIAAMLFYTFVVSLMEGKTFSGDSAQWATLVLVLGISLRLGVVTRPRSGAAQRVLKDEPQGVRAGGEVAPE